MDSHIKQVPLTEVGDTPASENYTGFEWSDGEYRVYFTACSLGLSVGCHIGVKDRKSKLALRQAVKEFAAHLFEEYNPQYVIARSSKRSMSNLLADIGFSSNVVLDDGKMYANEMRLSKWDLYKTLGMT